ncbi:MAG TPA: ketoacyl-ACP synthase III [Flavobacteriales bacterium]|nr:ketoacyl-ACP synthase III [Flavobacteriales bacterium]HIN39642.1 ketoacyl-ACP synthase III [Flavobacteriales bacterium]
MKKLRAAITAVHGYVPDYVLTNEELATMVDTNDEWIRTRTGVSERRILKGEDQGSSVMGAEAVKGLCEKRGISTDEIDMILCATATPDMLFPATANIIADKVGARNAFGYDVLAACSGFLYALVTASKYVESGSHKKVVVVGADKMSSIVDYTDRATCILFGDGAGAVLLEPTENDTGIIDSVLKSDGVGRHHLYQKAGGSAFPANQETVAAKEHFIHQDGKTVFKFAVKNMADVSFEVMERNNLSGDDIDWLVPHQANKRIIDATASRMNLDPKKVMLNIQRYGNTTTATIPLCLWEWETKLKKDSKLMLAAFGGGFTWGAVYLKWSYNT